MATNKALLALALGLALAACTNKQQAADSAADAANAATDAQQAADNTAATGDTAAANAAQASADAASSDVRRRRCGQRCRSGCRPWN